MTPSPAPQYMRKPHTGQHAPLGGPSLPHTQSSPKPHAHWPLTQAQRSIPPAGGNECQNAALVDGAGHSPCMSTHPHTNDPHAATNTMRATRASRKLHTSSCKYGYPTQPPPHASAQPAVCAPSGQWGALWPPEPSRPPPVLSACSAHQALPPCPAPPPIPPNRAACHP